MKNKLIGIILIFAVFIGAINFSFASTETYERNSNNNYGITKNIEMTRTRIYTAQKTPYVDEQEKIYDFANLFTESEEKKLYEHAQQFIEETELDIVIVTIDENNKSTAMAYADDFYDYNNFGIGNENSGILFLIDMDNRKMWISTTGNAISIYTNSRINSILDNCEVPIKSEKYFETADTFITSAKTEYTLHKTTGWIVGFIIAAVISAIVPTIFCLIKKLKHKTVAAATNADCYLEKDSIKYIDKKDIFIRTYTSRTVRQSSSSSGRGHSGSSGVRHGGGGRSF